MLCDETISGQMTLRYTGCVVNGRVHPANAFWEESNTHLWLVHTLHMYLLFELPELANTFGIFRYYCEQLGSKLKLNLGGCLFRGDRTALASHVGDQTAAANYLLDINNSQKSFRQFEIVWFINVNELRPVVNREWKQSDACTTQNDTTLATHFMFVN